MKESLDKYIDFIINNKQEYNRMIDIISKGSDRDKLKEDLLRGLCLVILEKL